ncbi:MAG: DEAD/DEAH box helicase, partial [Moorellaceae bacterium]
MTRSLSLANIFEEILPSYGFEQREGQEFMAYHVETTIKERNILIAEAGVGTGKTFAYLIPALTLVDWSSELLRKILIISTNTIVLQHQLMGDISRLIQLLHIKIDPDSIVLAKGKTNFLCPAKAAIWNISLGPELCEWVESTSTGDRNEAPPCSDEIWQAICVDESCNCSQCEQKTDCCYQKQRQKWLRAR